MTLTDIVCEYILGNLTIDELQQALDDWLYSEICKDFAISDIKEDDGKWHGIA